MKAREVVRADIRAFLSQFVKGEQEWRLRSKRQKAPFIAHHLLALLRAAYRWGQEEEVRIKAPDGKVFSRALIDRLDPTKGVERDLKIPMRAKERQRHLSDEEIPVFWRALDALKPAWSTFLRVILLCGTRRGETHQARWTDIDLEKAEWHIPDQHRKGHAGERKALLVPLSPLAVRLLTELKPKTWMRERVFVAQGFSIGLVGDEQRRVLAEAAKTAASDDDKRILEGLADLTIHDLRRSTARGLERRGAPPHVISLALGHARTLGATATDHHYIANQRPQEVRQWLDKWGSHVEGLLDHASGATVLPFEKRV